jgi:hypothetical protein
MDDDGPGTPLGRLKGLSEYAIEHGLCTGLEAKPPELFLIEEIERMRKLIVMAYDRLYSKDCLQCVDVARSYLQEAMKPSTREG